MAYGTPRAVIFTDAKQYVSAPLCVPCVLELVCDGTIGPRNPKKTLKDLAYEYPTRVLWPEDFFAEDTAFNPAFEFTTGSIEKFLSADALAVNSVLCEGQFSDQEMLDEYECEKCGKPLRARCTDY